MRAGVDRKYFARELKRLCGLALQEAPTQAADPTYRGEEVAFVQTLAEFVAAQAEALLNMASDIPKFDANNF
jgi:serine/threonine-protein kinase HipA